MAPLFFSESIVFPFQEIFHGNRILDRKEKHQPNGFDKSSMGNKPQIKVERDLDDCNPQEFLNRSVHLCNRCWSTFVGIDAYFTHRNEGCEDARITIEGCQNSKKELVTVNAKSNDENVNTTSKETLSSREIKLEQLDSCDIHKQQESTNISWTPWDRSIFSSPINSNHYEQNLNTNLDPHDQSCFKGGTCYINPKFPSAKQNVQWIQENAKQPVEKVPQDKQNNPSSGCSNKRNMNVLSPEQLSSSVSTQPRKKIKLSESSKELSRELAKILRNQMSEINKESKNTQNASNESLRIKLSESMKSSKELDTALKKQMKDLNKPSATPEEYYVGSSSLSKYKEKNNSENLHLLQKSINLVSFQNKYSEAFKSRSEMSKNNNNHTKTKNTSYESKFRISETFKSRFEMSKNNNNHTKNKNTSYESKFRDSDEKYYKSLYEQNLSKYDSNFNDTKSTSFEWKSKNERFYNAINPPEQRKSKFRSNTLVMYDLNINTRREWVSK
ncbi:unnamed protein product [Meganyctiphanes norvegica]|uniref:Uncharacterized protein n=1 Tax=Meganyctiphanes norvegica TaxID=48144 RepID=A0AAV2S5C7_MEGNR